MRKISITEVRHIEPDWNKFNLKEEIALDWLFRVHKFLIDEKIAEAGDILPSKKDIADFLGVSTGCVQNALRQAEDLGYFISKQCLGTMLSLHENKNAENQPYKMLSKKDKAVIEIKKHLIQREFEQNEILPTVLELAHEIKTSPNTARLAVLELIHEGILRKEIFNRNVILFLNKKIKLTENEKITLLEKRQGTGLCNKNLTKILKEQIKKYLIQNYKEGDKILSNKEFAKLFKVSVRTINSAMKELNKDKIILSRRGNYGSVFLNTNSTETRSEKSVFMTNSKERRTDRRKTASSREIKKNYSYKWEVAYTNIKQYILKNHEAGDKTLSMQEFAKMLLVSVTTIKKAVHELSRDGILYTQKGKYGGLFITEMPQKEDSYQWLAINPKYFEE